MPAKAAGLKPRRFVSAQIFPHGPKSHSVKPKIEKKIPLTASALVSSTCNLLTSHSCFVSHIEGSVVWIPRDRCVMESPALAVAQRTEVGLVLVKMSEDWCCGGG